jgi:hypothetical protein
MHRRIGTGLAWSCIAALGLSLLGGDPAEGQSLFRTNRVIEQAGNACLRGDECTIFEAEGQEVKAGSSIEVAFECPADHPYLRNWDATRHEHVFLSLSPARIGKGPLTLIAHNQADAPGSFKVLLGCAKEPASVTSVAQSLGSLPTNVAAVRRSKQ